MTCPQRVPPSPRLAAPGGRRGGPAAATFATLVLGCLASGLASCAAARGPGTELSSKATATSEAGAPGSGTRTPSTFSIVARDGETGDLGVAVASKYFAVGNICPWARAGVGAVCTQSWSNVSFGPRGLDLLAAGRSPEAALEELLASDPRAHLRQVGIVDARGRTAVHTGDGCTPWAGHRRGPGYSVQGNILVSEATVGAMARAFEGSTGELPERLLAALEAGERAGGDARGRQSAALIVVREDGGFGGYTDRYVRLFVHDHADPIAELRRLLELERGRGPVQRSRELRRSGKPDEALEVLDGALASRPSDPGLLFAKAEILARAGRTAGLTGVLRKAVGADPSYAHHHWRAAGLLARAGLHRAARERVRQALERNPEYRHVAERALGEEGNPLRETLPDGLESLQQETEERTEDGAATRSGEAERRP